jgi:hypothetical protein
LHHFRDKLEPVIISKFSNQRVLHLTFWSVMLPRIETLDENHLVVAGCHSFPNMARPNLELFIPTKGVQRLAKEVKAFAANDKRAFLEERFVTIECK